MDIILIGYDDESEEYKDSLKEYHKKVFINFFKKFYPALNPELFTLKVYNPFTEGKYLVIDPLTPEVPMRNKI